MRQTEAERLARDCVDKVVVKNLKAAQTAATFLYPEQIMGDTMPVFWSSLTLSEKHRCFLLVQKILEKAVD